MGDNRFVGGLYLKNLFIAASYLIFHKNHYSIFSDRAPDNNELITSNKKDQVSSLI